MDASPILLVLNQAGLDTAEDIAKRFSTARIHGLAGRVPTADTQFNETIEHIQLLFQAGHPIVGFCASGILIRALAPVLSDKRKEPPVIAVSEDGSSIVPLLGGHRGANELARLLAKALGGHAAITTAGDTALGIALDAPPAGWKLANPEDAKPVMAELLSGATVLIEGPADWLKKAKLPQSDDAAITLLATDEPVDGSPTRLVFHPQKYVVGAGCARGCDPDELINLVDTYLALNGIAKGAVACVATIDLKADEVAMNALADHLDAPLRLFTAEELETQTPRLKNPSEVVYAEVKCHGVAEGAALAAVGQSGKLAVEKQKTANATCAIARSIDWVDPKTVGRARGHLSVIGIGPGKDDWRTPEATRLLSEASDVVGYSLYLDIVEKHISGKKHHNFPLGAEEDRVRFALEEAGKGKTVALISSGDAGIYAMGALVYELLDRETGNGGVSDAAKRVSVTNAPGISALQACSARIGAPLGHDFCAISLSDLLTPWEAIEKRLKAAAQGDFVIAFYNPVSKRRRTQLAAAKDILLEHRPPETPVVLGVNLGRPEETIRVTTLTALTVDEVDMLTTVLVGSSNSKAVQTGSGSPFVYTPRGYAKRIDAPKEAAEDPAQSPEDQDPASLQPTPEETI
ncbi:precorrin-3B C(17)-methyltransferase [Roseibium denhamense]|uniref:Cobalt-precorrin 5A hydrolase / precorrin-3B C17-methyltransferase n=1 Tax=Roseibium denhamense TaxID=76305 RepID=A0ABY1PKU4_9HYPH|nr:precorrin-3B C(17)-methyltransferase [Roseibium denhamense]MTI05574.1 precorrin-3B C(17)-methyltransferase [Roseibium denhamense]SMP34662.1 cobalt-precorrin 5A hydrolase / precorrin-3B C17-methyltransferase [Roseibium denhamense]